MKKPKPSQEAIVAIGKLKTGQLGVMRGIAVTYTGKRICAGGFRAYVLNFKEDGKPWPP